MSAVIPLHRAAIVALLRAVPNIGIVHERERFAANEQAFRALYLYTPAGGSPAIRGWWLRRTASATRRVNSARTLDVHTWQIRGVMAFDDVAASEIVFDALIDAARDAVRADPTLGGVTDPGPLDEDGGLQLVDAGPVRFAGVLCHGALLQLHTWSYQ